MNLNFISLQRVACTKYNNFTLNFVTLYVRNTLHDTALIAKNVRFPLSKVNEKIIKKTHLY